MWNNKKEMERKDSAERRYKSVKDVFVSTKHIQSDGVAALTGKSRELNTQYK